MCFRVYMFRFKSSINIFITFLTIVVRYHLNTKKKYILRGHRNTRYHEKILSNKKKSYNFVNFLKE